MNSVSYDAAAHRAKKDAPLGERNHLDAGEVASAILKTLTN
jgi:hypothetical protein